MGGSAGGFLFVYGTLRHGEGPLGAPVLAEHGRLLGTAFTHGVLYQVDPAFPGLRAEGDGLVHGELWELVEPEDCLAALDLYEGGDFERAQREVVLDASGERILAWLYLYVKPVHPDQLLASGRANRILMDAPEGAG